MKKSVVACLGALAALLLLPVLPADAGELLESMGDSRVKKSLEEESLLYRINEHGQFLLTFEVGEGEADDESEEIDEESESRTHLVVVNSNTSRLDLLEIREIFCIGYQGAPLSKVQMSELLRENSEFVLGAWEISDIETDDEGNRRQTVRFCIRIDADCSAENLHSAIFAAAQIGDRLEAEWLGTDNW